MLRQDILIIQDAGFNRALLVHLHIWQLHLRSKNDSPVQYIMYKLKRINQVLLSECY